MLSVIIPTYKKAGRLQLTLRALVALTAGSETEILVVEDGDSASEAVRDGCGGSPAVRLIHSEHRGRSAARNCGAGLARGQRLLFLDDDMLVGPGVLCEHARARGTLVRGTILSLPGLVAFDDPATGTLTDRANRTLSPTGARGLRRRTVRLERNGSVPLDMFKRAVVRHFESDLHAWLVDAAPGRRWPAVTGAHFSIDSDLFRGLGGFDENMGLEWGAEDLEFGYRADRAGVPIVHSSDAVACHMDHDARGRSGQHRRAFEYFARKHDNPRILRLLDYFAGRCSLEAAVA